jgi:DNA-directed RNA polymerase specialized sigma24 family protein
MVDESEITLEQLIAKAVAGDKKALDLLIVHWWTIQLLIAVSIWAEGEYHQDRDDVRQIVHFALFRKITTLRNRHHLPWCKCLKLFCFKVAKNHCLGRIDHEKAVAAHAGVERAEHDAKSVKGSTFVLRSTGAPTPEQELLKKERRLRVEAAIRKVVNLYPQDEELLGLWLEDPKVKNIAEALGKSVKTIYPRLRRVQKALCRELGTPMPMQTKNNQDRER